MEKEKIRDLVKKLTLDEKIAMTTGKNMWETWDVERLGIPSFWMSDGPHGLRKGVTGNDNDEVAKSVSFPAECLVASGFDRNLVYELGQELGIESQGYNVQLLLGPGINMKRSPLCGRNFEYLSEDPYVAGELASSYINGIQSKGVGACVKHFFANNEETRRFSISAEVSERAIREIYLKAFEIVIKKANPWAVMASYNRINGVQSTENSQYNIDVLRDEWGYEGCLISDWGATHNRGRAVKAGTDLTMPGENYTNEELKKAVKEKLVKESDLDKACEHILTMVYKGVENRAEGTDPRMEYGHEVARKVAAQSAILLKNTDKILPLSENDKVAFIGGFCKEPRYQGGGSSHVSYTKLTSPYHEAGKICDIEYSPGYKKDGSTTDDLIAHAKDTAKKATKAVLFVGLPDSYEFEGADRSSMRLPDGHVKLIQTVTSVQPNTVVVLFNGSPVEMPWAESPKAIVEMYLPGEAAGEATVDILWGRENPSGRLAETFPYKLSDNPSYLFFPGDIEKVSYAEDVYIGYRYYETKKVPVRYPFGYGLSYTTFNYSNLKLEYIKDGIVSDFSGEYDGNGSIRVNVDVTNTGKVAGREVVQLYVAVKNCSVPRPVKEIKGFDKVYLEPGETKTVSIEIDRDAFTYWNSDPWNKEKGYFRLASGDFEIQVSKSAAEYVLTAPVTVVGEKDKFHHPILDENLAERFLEFDYGKEYLENNREIIEKAAGCKMEEFLSSHTVFELRILTPDLPYFPWWYVIDKCNGNY